MPANYGQCGKIAQEYITESTREWASHTYMYTEDHHGFHAVVVRDDFRCILFEGCKDTDTR